MPGISENNVILNLLTCRIKRGYEVNRSAKMFLEMVRPELKKLARIAIRNTRVDLDTAFRDLESETIMRMQHGFVLGDIGYPMYYLFGHPNGHISRYAFKYSEKPKKYERGELLSGAKWIEAKLDTVVEDHEETETEETRCARAVIEDGVTLTLSEYRVITLCMLHAKEPKRPLNGLHDYIARMLKTDRNEVNRLMKSASNKIREATLNYLGKLSNGG